MNTSLVRLLAALALSGQALPVGLPFVCDQVRRGAPASCEQQMMSQRSVPTVAAATDSIPCINTALCATAGTAVPPLTIAVTISPGESHQIGFGVSSIAPVDPQPPLPPPPQA